MHRLQKRRSLASLTPQDGTRSVRRIRLASVALAGAVVIALDQITKSLAVDKLSAGPVHLVGPLSLALSYNTGVAFSIGTGLTLPIIVVGFVLVLLLFWFARGAPSMPAAIATGMILGGALSNLADRLFRNRGGAVVDFIHLGFWPTFNLADASIVLGAVALVLTMVLGSPGTTSSAPEPPT